MILISGRRRTFVNGGKAFFIFSHLADFAFKFLEKCFRFAGAQKASHEGVKYISSAPASADDVRGYSKAKAK